MKAILSRRSLELMIIKSQDADEKNESLFRLGISFRIKHLIFLVNFTKIGMNLSIQYLVLRTVC